MSMNVYADLDFEDPELELAKARVAHVLHRLMDEKCLSDSAAAQMLGMAASELDAILDGHWDAYSVEHLVQFVNVLDPGIRFNAQTGQVLEEVAPVALTA